ncbi:MAG: translocation/assembly module TamB domain-containing protein, partial [Thiohalospira sp.]
ALTLSRLDGAGGAIAGRGVWHPEEARGAADLDSDGLALPRGIGHVDRLRATGGGTPDHWDLDLEAAASPPGYPSASARLGARGSAGTIRWQLLELAALDGTARGTGSLELAGGQPWQADLAWEDLESEALLPEWPATLSGETRLRGTLTAPPEDRAPEGSRGTPEVIVDHLALKGDLRGHALDLRGSGAWSPAAWRLEGLEASVGENRLSARAHGPQRLAAGVELEVPEPDLIHPDLRGRLKAHLDWADGAGEGLVTATDLRWGDGVSMPRLRASVDGSPEDLRAALAVPAITWEGHELGGLALNLAGPPREPQWTLAAGRPRLALAGTVRPLRGRLTATTGTAHLGGALWELEGALAAHLDGAAWGVESGCWLSDAGGRLCAGAQGSDTGGSAALDLEGLELAPLARLLPGGTRLQSGVLGSRAHLAWSETIDRLDLTARATDLDLVHPRQEEAIAARLRSVDLTAGYAGEGGLQARTTVRSAEPAGELTADVQLPRWRWAAVDPAQPLEGSVTADGVDLAWIGPLAPGFLRTKGRLEADVDLAGTLGEPLPRGRAEWREGRVRLAETGLDLHPVTATIIADGAAPLQLEARAGSGDGHLALDGTFQPRPPMTADLRLTGDGARVADLPEARVAVRPDIRLVVTPESASVEGEVRIPEARLVLPEGSGGGVSPSPDVVYRTEAPESAGLPLTADIRLLLGQRVYLRGHGFRGRLEGDLRLIQEPGTPTRGRGELVIQDGHYRAWGQELTIDDGRLLFADTPVDNPGLDLRAERPGLSVTAGVHVGGRLQDPSLRLFSDPPMEDSEILSWVVLGRPLESASGEEGASLAAAATALQLAGGGRLANELGDRFGIDEVGIASGTTADSAALVLGTWLSPRLYVRYAIGLTEDINTLRTRYLLDEQWTLEAETGAASGIDLLWSIDR